MSCRTPDVITSSRILIEAMGSWPTFHDAHLLRVERADDTLHIVVHAFVMTDDVDAKGYCVLAKHHLVSFELARVVRCTLPANYDGDTLFSLTAQRTDGGILVTFESAIDDDRSWQALCGEARIRGITPCDARGNVLQVTPPPTTVSESSHRDDREGRSAADSADRPPSPATMTPEQRSRIRVSILAAQCMGFVLGGFFGAISFSLVCRALLGPNPPPFQWPTFALPFVVLLAALCGAWLCARPTRRFFTDR